MSGTISDISSFSHGWKRASGGSLILQRRIASSGEGSIYLTDDPLSLAKIYHAPSIEKAEKLQHMLGNPPEDPTLSQGHISIAWPKDLILDKQGAVGGFLMPKIRGGVTLPLVYNPRLRRKKYPAFNWYYLHTTALNLAWILEALHEKGYIVGDLKPENFLVNDRALVSILDTDSFQIPGKLGQDPFLCPVASEGFTPPELFGKDLSKEPRQPLHDHFGLAVLIYQLLFGMHPFAGVWKGSEEPPSLRECIQKGLVPFSSNKMALQFVERSPLTPSLDSLPKALQNMFLEAFVEGHWSPSRRPSAQQWHKAIEKSLEELQVCADSTNHFLYPRQGRCPWCQLSETTGIDVFPLPPQGEKLSAFTILKLFDKALSEGELEKAETFLKSLKDMADAKTSIFQKAFLLFDQIKNEQHFITSFAHFLETSPEEIEILGYFKKHPFLETSSIYTLKSPLLQGKNMQEIKENARVQTEVEEKLNTLQKKASQLRIPLSFLFEELLILVPEKESNKYPLFSTLTKDIQEARQLLERYRLLKQHILEGGEEGLFLWHPCFEYPLQRDGLWIPFLDLIRSHVGSLSSASQFALEKTQYFKEEKGIWVRLKPSHSPRQSSPVQSLLKEGCLIFICPQKEYAEEEQENALPFYFPIPPHLLQGGQVDFFIDVSFVSSKHQYSFSIASLWYLEKTPLTQGPLMPIRKVQVPTSLRVKISRPSFLKIFLYKSLHALFPSYFSDKIDITISFFAQESLSLPPFILKMGKQRVSLDLDLSSQSKIVGSIPALLVQGKMMHKEKIKVSLRTFLIGSLKKNVWSIEQDPSVSSHSFSPFYFSSL